MFKIQHVWLIAIVTSDDTFIAFDCQYPENSKFFNHDFCNIHTDKLEKDVFTIVQREEVKQIKGISCSGETNIEVSYCGRYSHDKFTGENIYGKQIIFTREECQRMADTGVYRTETQSFQIKAGVNMFKTFTHGSVKFDGTNLACTGGEMRLSDGSINGNMIQHIQYKITVSTHTLMVVGNMVIDPYTQTELGLIDYGTAQSFTTRFVWPPSKEECKMVKIMEVELESIAEGIWFSNRHQIQIKTLDTFYDQGCKLKLTKTNAPGLFITEKGATIKDMNSKNVDMSVDLQLRFDYVNSKIASTIVTNYKNQHPICSKIKETTRESVTRTGESTFIKNLGEVSLEFTCKKIEVTPIIGKTCNTLLKVRDYSNKEWFLEPVTRILMRYAAETPCSPANVPVYRNTENELVSFIPQKRKIQLTATPRTNTTTQEDNKPGLYPQQMVKEWLSYSFMQHLSKHAYNLIATAACRSESCQAIHQNPSVMIGYIGNAAEKMAKAMDPTTWIEDNMEKIGRKCSIAVCVMTVVYAIYYTLSLMVKFTMFKDKETGCLQTMMRAMCPGLFIVTKITQNNKNNV